jgi:RNA polymerase sigma factor (sigma-70 family)
MTAMENASDLELIRRYAGARAEDAFGELVRRHVNLVYSAALRQVRSPQLAEEVAQSALITLARNAARLAGASGRDAASGDSLAPWLYQVTRRCAIDVVRREERRQVREQIATEINAMNAPEATWAQIEPLLDEAVSSLDDTDRAAVLLRYFENKSLREVGRTLGVGDDAAQKRVSRAMARLRDFFARRGVTVGAGGFALLLSANTVQAAPLGMAVAITTAVAITGPTIAAAAVTQGIVMTTLQKTLIAVVVVVAAGAGVYQNRQVAQLRAQNEALQVQAQQARQAANLAAANAAMAKPAPKAGATVAPAGLTSGQVNELMKLRGKASVNAVEIAQLKSALMDQREKFPEEMLKTMKRWLASEVEGQKQAERANASGRAKQWVEKLGLSPDQEQQMRAIFQAGAQTRAENVMARVTGAVPYEEIRARNAQLAESEVRELAGVLNAGQMANYNRITAEETDANYRAWAARESTRVAAVAQLAPEQKERVAAILYELKPGNGGEAIPGHSNAKEQLDLRMQSLGAVLNAAQLAKYRQVLQEDIDNFTQLAKIGRTISE